MSEQRDYGDETDYARIETRASMYQRDRMYVLDFSKTKTLPRFAFDIPFILDSSIPEGEIHLRRFGKPITKLTNFTVEEAEPSPRFNPTNNQPTGETMKNEQTKEETTTQTTVEQERLGTQSEATANNPSATGDAANQQSDAPVTQTTTTETHTAETKKG